MKNVLLTSIIGLLLTFAGCSQPTSSANQQNLTATEVKQLIESDKEVVILDVRTPEEFTEGHVAGATNLDFYAPDFEQQLEKLDTTNTYLVYCASGNRSGKAASLMQNKGFKKIINSQAGFNELQQAAVPTK